MMWLAAALAVAAGFGGLYVSYYLNTAAGASIAAVTVVLYAAAAAAALVARGSWRRRRWRPALGGREHGYARTP
jgi:ABC-type Mn2+/Zn2+ transport system permease subunit